MATCSGSSDGDCGGSKWEHRILLTGGCGFIGSHVAIRLVTMHPTYLVVCLDKLDYCSSLRNIEAIVDAPNFKFIKGDIGSADLVNHIFKSERIDTVLHFAAQSHVDNSFGNSVTFTINNVVGTHILLESAKLFKSQLWKFIMVSTDEVYGESKTDGSGDGHAFDTTSVLSPTNPYAATKAAAEQIAMAYYRSFELPIIVTRGNNVYGPHQYPEKLIPKFINLLLRGRQCTLHGDGTHRRSFLYVEDVADAFDKVLHKGQPGSYYNIGTSFEITNKDVALSLIKRIHPDTDPQTLIQYVEDRDFNDRRYHIEHSTISSLGWEPKVDWDEGIQRTIAWYREHQEHWDNVEGALVAHPRLVSAISLPTGTGF